jgi:methylenetetrahydrofolate reductase (NADPH)
MSLKAKVAAGAQFVQTQFCMDTAVVRRYTARLADAGLSVPLLIGVNPMRSARSAAWMRNHLFGTIIPDTMVARLEQAEDAAAEGRKICVETIKELSLIPGVAGVHIMAPENDSAIPEVITAVRRTVTMAKVE